VLKRDVKLQLTNSLLQRRRSTEANQTLHDVWPSPARLHYVYIFGGCCPVTEFCQVQNSLCVLQVLRSPIGSVAARHSSSGREPKFAALSRGRHVYSAGRPSRWALAHILVLSFCSPILSGRRLYVYHTSTHGVALVTISEIVNYLGQVTSEVKWDNVRFVARETMFVTKQIYAGNPLLRYYFDCH